MKKFVVVFLMLIAFSTVALAQGQHDMSKMAGHKAMKAQKMQKMQKPMMPQAPTCTVTVNWTYRAVYPVAPYYVYGYNYGVPYYGPVQYAPCAWYGYNWYPYPEYGPGCLGVIGSVLAIPCRLFDCVLR
jgi:hypothetical protein